jgi:predicted enzyme related to lactoylglutathione lyase
VSAVARARAISVDWRPREAEVERLLALGASLAEDHRKPDGTGWAVLTDPEGNEFCVVRSAAERASQPVP